MILLTKRLLTENKLAYIYRYNYQQDLVNKVAHMGVLNSLIIEGSPRTPSVDFSSVTGDLILSGRSIPENAIMVYQQLYDWVTEYSKNAHPTTNLRLNLEYFNTASSIWIAKIVKVLCTIDRPEAMLMIHLYFGIEEFESMESDDIQDALSPFTDLASEAVVSVGIKIYGSDRNGMVVKENIVLL